MKGRMLIVDDEALFRQGFTHLVGNNPLGWEVVGEASDGEEALNFVEKNQPDLIVTDINMPIMDGLELARQLQDRKKNVMIIILTGYREFEYAQRALRYGAVDFLLKPFSLDEACEALRRAHERYLSIQADLQAREEGDQPDPEKQWREELTLLLTNVQVDPIREGIEDHLNEASHMELAECKSRIRWLLRGLEDAIAHQLNRKSLHKATEQYEFDSLLWMHHVNEVIDWGRRRSEEKLSLLEQILEDRQDQIINRVIQYVEAHYAHHCTLQAVAEHVHMTPNYLSYRFKKEMGEGFSQYVNRRRIDQAKLLLQNTRHSMSAIAEQTGFDTSSYFTTVFKQLTGLSPRAFRKQHENRD